MKPAPPARAFSLPDCLIDVSLAFRHVTERSLHFQHRNRLAGSLDVNDC